MADSEAASGSSFFAQFQMIAKVALGAAAIAYAIGVFLVSFDLAQYKVANFSLARPQYVFAGAVWLVTTAVAIGPAFLGAALTKLGEYTQKDKFRRIYLPVVWVVFCAFILTKAIQVLRPTRTWDAMPYTTLAETVFFVLAWTSLPSRAEVHGNHDKKTNVSLVPSVVIFSVIALFIWTAAYNIEIFPKVEPSLGGGKHLTAQVVFSEAEQGKEGQLQEILGPIPRQSPTTSCTLTVLLVDADFVVIVFEDKKGETEKETKRRMEHPTFLKVLWRTLAEPDEPVKEYKTVLIKKSLVAAIRYDSEQPLLPACL